MKRSCLLAILALSGIAASRTLLVPEEYVRIQDALIHARDGDTVSVRQPVVNHPQVHYKSISFRGRTITVINRDSGSSDIFSPSFHDGKGDFSPQNFGIADCGDCNGDGRITGADATYLISYIYRGGSPPLGQGDVNLDGRITGADATYITNYIYRDGLPPCYEGWIGQAQVNEPDTLFDAQAKIDMDPNGYPWVVWMGDEQAGDGEGEIFYRRWNGSSWEPEDLVNVSDTLRDYRPVIAIDDSGTAFVAWHHYYVTSQHEQSDIWYSRWNGSNWDLPLPVSISIDRVDYAPVISSGGGETWVVWYGAWYGPACYYHVFASKWNDAGWDPEIQVSPPDTNINWWAYVAVDDSGRPHVVYSAYFTGGIYYSTYIDSVWTQPVLVSDTTLMEGYNPAIEIDENGGLHVVWVGVWLDPVVDYDIYYSFSSDGINWSEPIMINEDDDWNDEWGRIAVNSPSDIWVVWHKEYSLWDTHVFVSHFDGISWSSQFRLNNDSTMTHLGPVVKTDNFERPWVVWSGMPDFYTNVEIYYNRWVEGLEKSAEGR